MGIRSYGIIGKKMKSIMLVLLFTCGLLYSASALSLDFMMGGGYSPEKAGTVLIVGAPIGMISPLKSGLLYMRAYWRDKNYPKGYETETEPFSWWLPTGREIWGEGSVCAGVLFDVPGATWMSFAPYIGWGSKQTYVEYYSTATGWNFFNKTEEQLFDAGIDIHARYKMMGVYCGYSKLASYNTGVFIRYDLGNLMP